MKSTGVVRKLID